MGDVHGTQSRKLEKAVAVRNSLLEGFSQQTSTLLESSSLIFWEHVLLSLPRLGHFPERKMAAGNGPCPLGMLVDFSSETATAFSSFFSSNLIFVPLSFCESAALNNFRTNDICITHAGFLEIDSRECFDARGFDSIA